MKRTKRAAWQIRAARAADWPTLAALLDAEEQLHAELAPRFFRKNERRAILAGRLHAGRSARDQAVLVAVDGTGTVSGMIHLLVYDTPPSPLLVPGRRGHVEDLVVAEAARRRGCAKALMAAGSAWARQRGCKQLLLTVWAGNRAAERLYKRLGYHRVSQVLGIDL